MKKIYLFLDKRTNLSQSWMVLSRNQNHLHRKHCNPRSLALFRSKIHQILERNKMRWCLQLYVCTWNSQMSYKLPAKQTYNP